MKILDIGSGLGGPARTLASEYGNQIAHSLQWFRDMISQNKNKNKKPLGFNIFVGPETPVKAKNLLKNLEENRIMVIQSVFQKK